ncbi:hypothetical protein K2Z83_18315 [Oscillochloris sp. ZM17-4]|uniref:aspartate/glutamate racemase family protein n=1 Tax=Oscillochloris sp. ZM17-4 TaxID=2866714 RepID=UPI001C73A61C|nr:aspartate/glutamate racemase family protein [Oscillochloris sp. ZM17-4]MBX0329628.1 hypothetical protein [Oscillochloris sp. ZM17-4]
MTGRRTAFLLRYCQSAICNLQSAMPTLALLHTSPVHVATFDALAAELAPGLRLRHMVAEDLLAEARAAGLTGALAERLAARLRDLADGAAAVLCTCSTIGGMAERTDLGGTPVLRVDRAMAEAALACGPRVALVAALESTLAPTRDLLIAVAAGRPLDISAHLCADAWAHFEAGATDAYLAAVAGCARAAAPAADVVVLAQASMAGAVPLLADLSIPALSSPRLGMRAALARMKGEG